MVKYTCDLKNDYKVAIYEFKRLYFNMKKSGYSNMSLFEIENLSKKIKDHYISRYDGSEYKDIYLFDYLNEKEIKFLRSNSFQSNDNFADKLLSYHVLNLSIMNILCDSDNMHCNIKRSELLIDDFNNQGLKKLGASRYVERAIILLNCKKKVL